MSALDKYLLSRGHNAVCRAHEGYPCACWHDEALAELERLQQIEKQADEETEEFNSGYDARMRDEPIENEFMYPHKHDAWSTGWAWADHIKRTT